MTEFDIQTSLFNHFKTLNTFSGIEFLKQDSSGKYLNAHFPNIEFNEPDDKRYFELTFRSDEPEQVSIMDESQNRYAGILYIDIITPQDVGEDECETKYRWIAKLFNDAEINDVLITNVYISDKKNEADHYRLLVAVEWTADIDKE